jgi:hypothetical protein
MPDPVTPEISGLTQSGPSASGLMPTPNSVSPPPDALMPATAPPDVTAPQQINPAIAPEPPKGGTPVGTPDVGGHTRLLAMVSGLAEGLSAFGTSLATKGQRGGVQQVLEDRARQQEMNIQAQQAAQAQKNADVQNKIANLTLNTLQMQNQKLHGTLQDEMTQSHVATQEAQTKLASAQFDLFAGTGMNAAQIQQLTQGGPVDGKTSGMLQANAQRNYRIAAQLLPSDNPTLVALKNVIDNPNTSPAALVIANNQLSAELKGQEDVNDAKIKQATAAAAAPFGDKADMVNDAILHRLQVNHPEIKTLPDGYKMTPDSTPKDLDRVDKLLLPTEQAEATKANRDIVNGMREQMLDLAKGAKIPGDETKTGPEYLATLPVGLAGTIKAIGEGRSAPPPIGSRSPAAQTILGALNRAYPDYDGTKYPSYLKTRTAFTSGPEGKGVNAINTVETHLARMYDHATAPGTSGGLTGRVTGFFGDKDVRALDIDRTAVSTELSKAYAAGQISEGEVRDWEAKLDFTKPGMTTGKLLTNLKEIDGLLEGKQKAYATQWDAASPSASIVSPIPIISSDAANARAVIRGEAPAAKTSAHNVGDQVTLKNGQQVTIKTMNPNGTFTY